MEKKATRSLFWLGKKSNTGNQKYETVDTIIAGNQKVSMVHELQIETGKVYIYKLIEVNNRKKTLKAYVDKEDDISNFTQRNQIKEGNEDLHGNDNHCKYTKYGIRQIG